MAKIKLALMFMGLFLVFGLGTAAAVCSNNTPADGETVICDTAAPNPDTNGVVNSGADNVTVIVLPGAGVVDIDLDDNANITNSGTIENGSFNGIDLDDNGTVVNSGSINGNNGDGVNAENNASVSNSGNINNNNGDGIDANNGTIINTGQINNNTSDGIEVDSSPGLMLIINTGQIVGNSDQGIDAYGATIVINSGLISNNGFEEVALSDENDVFENLPGGQVIDTPSGPAIRFFDGNDTMIIHVGSFVVGYISGGAGFDTFILTGDVSDEELWAFLQENSKCGGSCDWTFVLDGVSYDLRNFENLTNSLVFRARPGEFVPSTQTLCEDGNIKVFRLPNGELLVYSGFNLRANGFLVAKITPADLAAQVRRFQEAGRENPGWYAEVDYTAPRSLRVFNAAGQTVGSKCGF
jgi:hypothetical protein